MQFARVLVNQKTKQWDDVFTYGIKPEFLFDTHIGSIVEVPFGTNRMVEGIIVGFSKTLPKGLRGEIKNIKRVLQKQFRFSLWEIEFSKWLAQKYFSSWSESLFSILPPVPKHDSYTEGSVEELQKNKTNLQSKLLIDSSENRYKYYWEIIKDNAKSKKTTWIIFPDLNLMRSFIRQSGGILSQYKTMSYYSGESVKKRWQKWLAIRSGKYDLVIGSRMILLNMPANVRTIIIDEASNSGHVEEQAPAYRSNEVAHYWQTQFGIQIVEGDIIPSLRQLVEIKAGTIHPVNDKLSQPQCKISLVDMNKEKSNISIELAQAIEETIDHRETMVILVPKKGLGSRTRCADCGYEFVCPNCDVSLARHEKELLVCYLCNYKTQGITSCPICKSNNIETVGSGVEKIGQQIKQITKGRYEVINLDKDTKLSKLPNAAIYVSTQAIFRWGIRPYISAVINSDFFLTKPDYSASEIAFYTMLRLAMITKKKMLIQANNTDLLIYQAFSQNRYKYFLRELLKERLANLYPPYGHILKIELGDTDKEKAMKRIGRLHSELSKIVPREEIIGPVPGYFSKERGNYKFQIIIKLRKESKIEQIRNLLFGEKIKVTIDPESLL
ncbi:MAG: hypothetical protein Q7S37_02995 [bacterium]|nr:hypothetical protein [bacterium]